MRRSLAAALGGFVVLGVFWGSWAAVLPDVQRATGASKAQLGIALLFIPVGSVPASLAAGYAIDRLGTRAIAVAGGAFATATLLPGLATTLPELAAALAVAGAASGALDVGINAVASHVEEQRGRRIMPLAHGLYSVGVLAGAVGAGVARGAGVHREAILVVAAASIAVVAAALALDRGTALHTEPQRLRFERALVVLGLVGVAIFVVEGGIESWSALFVERTFDARPQVSGLGPGLFGAAMAAGRFAAQAAPLPERTVLAVGAALAAAGCALAAASPNAPFALTAFALGGLGVSVGAPILFGAAGRTGGRVGSSVGTVVTLSYTGFLAGPPIVGGVAQASSLRVSFVVLAVVAAAVAAAATRLRL